MIRKILLFSLRNRWAVIIAAVVLSLVGYWCFTKLKIEAYPDIADTNVIIVAPYDGRAAEEVERTGDHSYRARIKQCSPRTGSPQPHDIRPFRSAAHLPGRNG
ncbi:MAG: efflux RND transporter permease subunit [Chitinophagaceae bacterium]